MIPEAPEFLKFNPPNTGLVQQPLIIVPLPNYGWWRVEHVGATVQATAALAVSHGFLRALDANNAVLGYAFVSSGVVAYDGVVAFSPDVTPWTPTVDNHPAIASVFQNAIEGRQGVRLELGWIAGADVVELQDVRVILRRVK